MRCSTACSIALLSSMITDGDPVTARLTNTTGQIDASSSMSDSGVLAETRMTPSTRSRRSRSSRSSSPACSSVSARRTVFPRYRARSCIALMMGGKNGLPSGLNHGSSPAPQRTPGSFFLSTRSTCLDPFLSTRSPCLDPTRLERRWKQRAEWLGRDRQALQPFDSSPATARSHVRSALVQLCANHRIAQHS